jgi:hypothetical protein
MSNVTQSANHINADHSVTINTISIVVIGGIYFTKYAHAIGGISPALSIHWRALT